MKNTWLLVIVVSVSLASTGAFASDYNWGGNTHSATRMTLNPAAGGAAEGNGVGQGGTWVSYSKSMSFNSLDRGHKGYLTRSDVASDPQISRHFSQCDTNHDGQLSRTEFRTCKRQYP